MALSADTKVIDEIRSRIPKPQQFLSEFEKFVLDRMSDEEELTFVAQADIREDKTLGFNVEGFFDERQRIGKGFVLLTDQNLYTLAPKMCSVYPKQSLTDYYEDSDVTRRLTGFIFPRKAVRERLGIHIDKRNADAFMSKVEKMGIYMLPFSEPI